MRGQSTGGDPERWYHDAVGKAPEYDDLLGSLAIEPAERQRLLRSYFETNEQEREEGLKQPTAAHRSIAKLASRGFIKVIITTNFDDLMERALGEENVNSMPLHSADQIREAPPLVQLFNMGCCVLKIHGDYRYLPIRNTTSELEEYPPEINQFLDRVFDEFGLIVCGWSAKWDVALRSALLRCPSRRYTTYWTHIDEQNSEAQEVINARRARLIPIADADTFFDSVQQRIDSLEGSPKSRPPTEATTVEKLKGYLSEPRYRLQLDDLVNSEVDQVINATSTPTFPLQGTPVPAKESITARVRAYDAACSTLLAMAPIGGYWVEEYHFPTWQRALQRLSTIPLADGNVLWLSLRKYPGTLLLYTLGLGAVSSDQLQFLSHMFSSTVHDANGETQSVVQVIASLFLDVAKIVPRHSEDFLEGMERHYVPLNDWIHAALRRFTENIIPSKGQYDLVFDRLELLFALGYAYRDTGRTNMYWAPFGAFVYRHDNRETILREIKDSISRFGDDSPFVKHSIFGETTDRCLREITRLEEFIERLRRELHIV